MKKQIRTIAAIAAATMILTGCATQQQRAASEQGSTLQNNTSQTQSSTAIFRHRDDTGSGELVAT